MNAFTQPVRRGLLLGVCACLLMPGGEPLRGEGPAAEVAGPLLGPAKPECLQKYPPAPVVKVNVSVPACAAPGTEITYHICVENTSTAEAHHVVIKNALPANAKFVRADPAPSSREPELQWPLGTIGGGAAREITLVLQPTNREDVKNCTRVQIEHGQCVTTRQAALPPGTVPVPPFETAPAPAPAPTPEPVVPRPMPPATGEPGTTKPPVVKPLPPVTTEETGGLTLTIEGPARQYVNLQSRYFLTLTNHSKVKATTVLLAATLPDKSKFIGASDRGQHLENKVAWLLGTLEPGAKRTLELALGAGEPGEWCVEAEALADKSIRVRGKSCTQFIGVSAVSIDLTDREDPVIVGARTSYIIPIRNPGSAPATNLKLRARVPAGLRVVRTLPPEIDKQETLPDGQWLEFATLPTLEPGKMVMYEVFVEATRIGEQRFRLELTADQLDPGRPVVEEENTTVFEDNAALQRNVPVP
jgi:uncharacterized repeat protein (TIGR01451 family)